MGNTHFSRQALHVFFEEHVAHKAVAFFHVETAVLAGGYACSILAAMLQHRQGFIKIKIHCAMRNNTGNTTHTKYPS